MKSILVLFAAIMLSTPANAEWKHIVTSETGNDFYLDFDTLRSQDSLRYIWRLSNYLKPDKWGDMSSKVLYEIDCRRYASKRLALYFYNQPMGEGDPTTTDTNFEEEYTFASPDSVHEELIMRTCNH